MYYNSNIFMKMNCIGNRYGFNLIIGAVVN